MGKLPPMVKRQRKEEIKTKENDKHIIDHNKHLNS